MPPTEEEIGQLFDLHNSPQRRQENLWRSYGFDPNRNWVGDGGYRLSDNIWRSRQDVRKQIDDLIRQAIANGTDALELADMVEQFLDPSLTPVRNANGKLIRNQRKGIVTEITRAHGQATIEVAKRTPFAKGVKWSISGSHPKDDPCDINATQNNHNLGAGVYPTDQVPRYPHHPMCLCVLSTVTPDDIDGVVNSLRDQYGLGDAVEEEQVVETVAGTSAVPRFGTKDAAVSWMRTNLADTVNVGKQDLSALQSLADGIGQILEPYGFKLSGIDLAPTDLAPRMNALARRVISGPDQGKTTLLFRESITRNARAAATHSAKVEAKYAANKANGLAVARSRVADPRRVQLLEQNQAQLDFIEAHTRWTVAATSADPIKVLAAHEAAHAVYYTKNLAPFWDVRIRSVPMVDKAAVSEYGASSAAELFAESMAARAVGVPLPQSIDDALDEVLKRATK
jgi:hypothetical protein